MSLALALVRPQIVTPRSSFASMFTLEKSPGELIGKPASIISTPRRKLNTDFQLLIEGKANARALFAIPQGWYRKLIRDQSHQDYTAHRACDAEAVQLIERSPVSWVEYYGARRCKRDGWKEHVQEPWIWRLSRDFNVRVNIGRQISMPISGGSGGT